MADELAPGFRFYPTEEELICFYLRNKLDGVRRGDIERVIPVADVCALDPWHLRDAHRGALSGTNGEPWFYFCPRQEREARGGRPSRTTPSGYWKAAGTPGIVYAGDGRPIGTKKTMVFYRGRAPGGAKTEWKLNEYKALEDEDEHAAAAHAAVPLQTRSEFSLCRLYTRSGCPRQFDRRPRAAAAAAAGGGSGNRPTAAASVANNDGEETGRKRKRPAATSSEGTSSSDGDGNDSTQQWTRQGGTDEELFDDMADWSEFALLDWF